MLMMLFKNSSVSEGVQWRLAHLCFPDRLKRLKRLVDVVVRVVSGEIYWFDIIAARLSRCHPLLDNMLPLSVHPVPVPRW